MEDNSIGNRFRKLSTQFVKQFFVILIKDVRFCSCVGTLVN